MTVMRPEIHIAVDWAIRCFGFAHVKDKQTRALRVVEEAIELAQATEVPKEKLLQLIEYVYARERGTLIQELGGVLMTTYLMSAGTLNEDPDSVFLRELRRVLSKSAEHFTSRNMQKVQAGFTRDPQAQAYFEDFEQSNKQENQT